MASAKQPPRAGKPFPFDTTPIRITGVAHTRMTRFGLKLRAWPRKRPGKPTAGQAETHANFKRMVAAVKGMPAWDRVAAVGMAHDTGWTWRDVLSKAVTGTLWEATGLAESVVPFILDTFSNIEGAMLYRGPTGWVGLLPGPDGSVIVLDGGVPTWTDPSSLPLGITQLTGDVLAGPGSGAVASVLKNTGPGAGTHHHATITIDAKGRITAAASGAPATTFVNGIVRPDNISLDVDSTGALFVIGSGPGGARGLYTGALSGLPSRASTGLTTWLNQGAASVSDTPVGLAITAPTGAGDQMRGLHKAAPSTPYVVNALFEQTSLVGPNGLTGIGWYDGTNKLHVIDLNHNAWEVTKWNTPSSFNGADVGLGDTAVRQLWCQLRDDGTNIAFAIGFDGYHFVDVYTHAKSTAWLGATGYSRIIFFSNPNAQALVSTLVSYTD